MLTPVLLNPFGDIAYISNPHRRSHCHLEVSITGNKEFNRELSPRTDDKYHPCTSYIRGKLTKFLRASNRSASQLENRFYGAETYHERQKVLRDYNGPSNALATMLLLNIREWDTKVSDAVKVLLLQIALVTARSLDTGCKIIKIIGTWAHNSGLHYPIGTLRHEMLSPRDLNEWSIEANFGYKPKTAEEEKLFFLSLATIGRALPNGTQALAYDKIDQFIERVCRSAPTIPESILGAVEDISHRICGRLGLPKTTSHFSLSTSSCIERSRNNGGRAKEIVMKMIDFAHIEIQNDWEALEDFRGLKPFAVSNPKGKLWESAYRPEVAHGVFRAPLVSDLGITTYDGIDEYLGEQTLLWASSSAYLSGYIEVEGDQPYQTEPLLWLPGSKFKFRLGRPYPTYVDWIGEPGYKVRVVNVPPASMTVLQQYCRHLVEPCLQQDRRYNPFTQMYYLVQGFEWFRKEHPLPLDEVVIKSTDYEGASDSIPFSVAERILKGILSGLKVKDDDPLSKLSDLLIAPRFLQSNHSWIQQRLDAYSGRHKRGTLLGDPFSFLILSMVTLINYELAEIYTDQAVAFPENWEILRSHPTSRHFYGQVLGDDAIAFATKNFSLQYDDIAPKLGMKLAPLKDGHSPFAGTYTEQFCYRMEVTQPFRYLDSIKARYLSPFNKSVGIEADSRETQLTKAAPLSRVISYYTTDPSNEHLKWIAERGNNIYYTFFPKMLKSERAGYPVGLPPICGGIGAPIQDDTEYAGKHTDHIALIKAIEESELSVLIQCSFLLNSLVRGSKKGLVVSLENSMELDIIRQVLLEPGSPGLFAPYEVLTKLELDGVKIPKRGGGDMPNWPAVIKMAKQRLNISSLMTLMRDIQRAEEFRQAFINPDAIQGSPVQVKLRNYEKAYSHAILEISKMVTVTRQNIDDASTVNNIRDLGQRLTKRLNEIFISKDHEVYAQLEHAPSFVVKAPH